MSSTATAPRDADGWVYRLERTWGQLAEATADEVDFYQSETEDSGAGSADGSENTDDDNDSDEDVSASKRRNCRGSPWRVRAPGQRRVLHQSRGGLMCSSDRTFGGQLAFADDAPEPLPSPLVSGRLYFVMHASRATAWAHDQAWVLTTPEGVTPGWLTLLSPNSTSIETLREDPYALVDGTVLLDMLTRHWAVRGTPAALQNKLDVWERRGVCVKDMSTTLAALASGGDTHWRVATYALTAALVEASGPVALLASMVMDAMAAHVVVGGGPLTLTAFLQQGSFTGCIDHAFGGAGTSCNVWQREVLVQCLVSMQWRDDTDIDLVLTSSCALEAVAEPEGDSTGVQVPTPRCSRTQCTTLVAPVV